MKQWTGVFPALITPYQKDGTIHKESLRQIVRMNMAKGVSGFYVGGSTSEAFLLSLEERKALLETVAEEVQGACTIIAHVGCMSTEQAMALSRHAQEVGADAVSSVAPFYYDFSFSEIKEYYTSIARSISLPLIIYHYPAFSGVHLTMDHLKELLALPQTMGVKYTSHDMFQLERIKRELPQAIVYNGYDQVFLAGLIMGADGAIGSTYNFMAERFVAIRQSFLSGNLGEAQRLQTEANDILDKLKKIGVIPAIKKLLELQGIECGPCRKPFRTITGKQEQLLKGLT